MDIQKMYEILFSHKGKVAGVLIGLLVGILIITLGFFRALFLCICISVGYFIGKKIDQNEDLLFFIEKLMNTQEKRF